MNNNENQNILKVIKMLKDDAESLLNGHIDFAKETEIFIDEMNDFIYKNNIETHIQKTETKDIKALIPKHVRFIEPILWEELCKEANKKYTSIITFDDILTKSEIQKVLNDYEKIEEDFSAKTSIKNKSDLFCLIIAIALQTVKTFLFPIFANKCNYGMPVDKSLRMNHDDTLIKQAHKNANDNFKEKYLNKYDKGKWINILYQSPAYDITKGSGNIGLNLGGAYHRMTTLGHDPILGWLFGVANILTDTITLNNFTTYNIQRNPMKIINENVDLIELFTRAYYVIKEHPLNLPSAIFAQAQHLKSDKNTKIGLPVPVLSIFNEDFASKLYKSGYDYLCANRDIKINSISANISLILDMIISLIHALYRQEDENIELYEVKTRKILLISNSIASTSTILNTVITKNYKNLDLGGFLISMRHLFLDTIFISKLKEEYIENEIFNQIKEEYNKIDELYSQKFH